MNYKLVIFDFDGTLADSFPFFLRSINTLAAAYNFRPIQPEHVDRMRTMNARELMKKAQLPSWKIPLVARAFIHLMANDIEQIQLFDRVPELLAQLASQGVQLAIVSSNSEANIRRILGPQAATLITHYSCGSSLFGKQRKFRQVIGSSGVTPDQVLCVGDELRDLDAAKEAGLAFGAVAWGYTRTDVLAAQPAIYLFHSVDDIMRTVVPSN
ncbi:HAD hydrolase-like protein [Fibrella sp. WM1]|uniref:HAD hydrolase-like protein n=1 Tax=Fibrella musci TaxID=3242485 RepID=UPI003520AC84